MFYTQLEGVVNEAEKVMGKGEGADVTVIGVMLVFCVVCGFITVALWRQSKKDKEHVIEQDKINVEAFTTMNMVIKNIHGATEKNLDKITDNGDKLTRIDSKVDIITNKISQNGL